MKNIVALLGGFIIGALLGGGLAILFAPSSGEALRTDIKQRIQNVQDEVRMAAQERRAELERQLADLRAVRRPEIT